jgi:hypothetical protein
MVIYNDPEAGLLFVEYLPILERLPNGRALMAGGRTVVLDPPDMRHWMENHKIRCEISEADARYFAKRCGKTLSPGFLLRKRVLAREQVGDEQHLPDRLEMILYAFEHGDGGIYRWKRIAELAGLHADSRLRGNLSELKRLGYLTWDRRTGYARTDKPFWSP